MYKKVTLGNGLRVIVEEVPHVRSVSLGVWIGSGSRYEEQSLHGVSHFIEHMLFKGTARRTAKQLADSIEGRGGQLNAFTTREYTCVHAKVLDEDIDVALDVISDMLINSRFDPQDVEKEKGVILEEISLCDDTPDDLVHELAARAAWPDHALGRDTLGTVESVQSFSRDTVVREFRQRFVSGNMAVVAAGNCETGRIVDGVERWFDALPRGDFTPDSVAPEVKAGRLIERRNTEQAHLCVVTPGAGASSPQFYPLYLLTTILGGGSGSRLFQHIREELGLAYSVYTYESAHRDCGLLTTYAGADPDNVEQVLDAVLREFESVRKDGITAEELESAKMQARGGLILGQESTSSRMMRLGKSEMTMCRPVDVKEVLERIDPLTLDDVMDAARASLGAGRVAIAAISPHELGSGGSG